MLKNNNKIIIKKIWYLSCVLASTVFIACNKNTFNSEKELLSYIIDEANGYKQSKTVNGYNFTLIYRPTDVLVKQELEDSISKDKIKVLREKYNKYLYFNLSMSRNHQELLSTAPKNRNEFGAMVNQLAFGMGEKVHLFTQSKDTLELADFIYPRMYGMGNATTIMFVYPREKEQLEEEFLNFTIEDLGLYTGEVKFKIDSDKINNEPKLKL